MLQQLTTPEAEAMRTSADIIDIHLTHIHAAGLAATTIETARFVLGKANRELSHGLACATGEELADWLANDRWVTKTKATYHLHLTGSSAGPPAAGTPGSATTRPPSWPAPARRAAAPTRLPTT
jgi:hypothetical protein